MIMKKHNDQNGFTLIEVVISMFMLIIGILGAIVMQNTATKGNSTAIHLTGAANWASDRQETLMALSYGDASLEDVNNAGVNAGMTGLDNTDAIGSLADGGPVVQDGFTVFWNVADNYPVFGNKTIRVIVHRFDKGELKTVTLDFIKMRSI
jgi:type II secretory pathway pseudopilin PulG